MNASTQSQKKMLPTSLELVDRDVVEVCDAVGAFIEYWGFKAVHGRVWTFLALHSDPVPQTRICDAMGLSRASVSIAMRELGEYGLVRRVGDHRLAPYEAVIDAWPIITNILSLREKVLLENARESLVNSLESVRRARQEGEELPYAEDRLQVLLSLTDLANMALRFLLMVRIPPKLGAMRARLDGLRGLLALAKRRF